jgi:phospholipid N-methyltransferase
VVEYGPGTGAFTEVILNLMTPASRLIATERNQGFYRVLMNKISDVRLTIFNLPALEVSENRAGGSFSCSPHAAGHSLCPAPTFL